MYSEEIPSSSKRWSAAELRRMPREQRDRILAEQSALIEEEYRTNPELTDFEAFGEDDLHGQSLGHRLDRGGPLNRRDRN